MVKPANKSNKKKVAEPPRPSPVSNIEKIGSLNKFPDKDYARDLLHQITKLVAPIIHENNFKVGTLCEMYPKNANLLGLNVNRGQKILIRLRYHSNDRSFYPLGDLIETFLHELTHNLHGKHDEKFYKFLDGLKQRFETLQHGGVIGSYRCEEEVLGSKFDPIGGYTSIRDKRIKELSKAKYKSESRKLGGNTTSRISKASSSDPLAVRRLMLEAAERRFKDSKWCPSDVDIKEVEPTGDEMDIIEINDDEYDKPQEKEKANQEQQNGDHQCSKEYKQVIDLTSEEYGEPAMEDSEVVIIDACDEEQEEKHKANIESPIQYKALMAEPKSILRLPIILDGDSDSSPKENKKVEFSNLLPSFDDEKKESKDNESDDEEIQYTVSISPGRTFFGGEDFYPRRKLVADLNFDQIFRKGDKLEPRQPKPSKKKQGNKKSSTSKKKQSKQPKESKIETKVFKKTVKPISFDDLL
ncbi:WLM domain-containing protein [Scheffersomyces coipomensis]|uniref:WLM domain-containing protein n=1 Tax=Scheffersomyces coipomensis TaxID=1788519 RepID=UPI00315CEC5B